MPLPNLHRLVLTTDVIRERDEDESAPGEQVKRQRRFVDDYSPRSPSYPAIPPDRADEFPIRYYQDDVNVAGSIDQQWAQAKKTFIANNSEAIKRSALTSRLLPSHLINERIRSQRFFHAMQSARIRISLLQEPPNLDDFEVPPGASILGGTDPMTIAAAASKAFFAHKDAAALDAAKAAVDGLRTQNSYRAVHVHFEKMTGPDVRRSNWDLFNPHGNPEIDSYNIEKATRNQTRDYVFKSYLANSSGTLKDKEANGFGALFYKRQVPRASKAMLDEWAGDCKAIFEEMTLDEWRRALQRLSLEAWLLDYDVGELCARASNRTVVSRRMRALKQFPWVVVVVLELKADWLVPNMGEGDLAEVTTAAGPPSGGNWDLWDDSIFTKQSGSWNAIVFSDRVDPKTVHSDRLKSKERELAMQAGTLDESSRRRIKVSKNAFQMVLVLFYDVEPTFSQKRRLIQGKIEADLRVPYLGSKSCVELSFDEIHRTIHVSSLFYNLQVSDRDKCQVSVGSGERDQGSGTAVLQTIFGMASALGFEKVDLDDVAQFQNVDTAPVWARSISMTPYLRLTRGYGFYEKHGLFDVNAEAIEDARAAQQSLLDYHHKAFTTPIGVMLNAYRTQPSGTTAPPFEVAVDFTPPKTSLDALRKTVHSIPPRLHQFSMRSIVLHVAGQFESTRHQIQRVPLDEFMNTWVNLGPESSEYEHATHIVSAASGICIGKTENKRLWTHQEAGGSAVVGQHIVCEAGVGGACPKAEVQSVMSDFKLEK